MEAAEEAAEAPAISAAEPVADGVADSAKKPKKDRKVRLPLTYHAEIADATALVLHHILELSMPCLVMLVPLMKLISFKK